MHGLGQDVFAAMMDEVAFSNSPESKQVREMYTAIRRRIESRYTSEKGMSPGLLILASSANYEGDFLDKHMQSVRGKRGVHISMYAIYDVKRYDGPRFRVLVGDKGQRSRILDRVTVDIDNNYLVEQVERAADDAWVIQVPAILYDQYEIDLEGALKDYSGIFLFSARPFLPNKEQIDSCVNRCGRCYGDGVLEVIKVGTPEAVPCPDCGGIGKIIRPHPFKEPEPILALNDEDTTLENLFLKDEIFKLVDPFRKIFRLRLRPGAPRFVHIDLAKTKDSVGIACVHVAGTKRILRADMEGRTQEYVMPVVYVDFILRIRPPIGSQIDFTKLTSFVTYLHKLGMPLGAITFDQYQCLTGDTKISMLDGTEVAIADLQDKSEFWVYSCDSEGNIVPGRGHSCRKTGEKVPVVRVVLDNGESVRCTDTHPFKLRDGTYRFAGELQPGDSLMPLYRHKKKLSKRGNKALYEYHWNPRTKRQRLTHTAVYRTLNPSFKPVAFQKQTHVIHHTDFNSLNNDPSNLKLMTTDEHRELHSEIGRANGGWRRHWDNPEWVARQRERASRTMKRMWESPAHRAAMIHTEKLSEDRKRKISEALKNNKNGNGTWGRSCRGCGVQFTATHVGRWYHNDDCFKQTRRAAHRTVCNASNARKRANNHKVLSVELDGFEDVYDITVDEHHNFALTAGVFVHNSTYHQQLFLKMGILSKEISLDRNPTAYNALKDAIMAGTLHMYHYEPVIDELKKLQRNDGKRPQGVAPIDHPAGGSKDCADALAGAHFACVTSEYAHNTLVEAAAFQSPALGQPIQTDLGNDQDWVANDADYGDDLNVYE
jgi:hypothetical protein